MERARDFVREQGLATIPAGEELEVVETPPLQARHHPLCSIRGSRAV